MANDKLQGKMADESNETCIELNDYLWSQIRDLTTRPIVMALFAIAYTVIIIVGITGNLCVLIAVTRTRYDSFPFRTHETVAVYALGHA